MIDIVFSFATKFRYMAILGQIRSRSIFLIIVIGLALFAFVISGVFDGKGFQSQEPVGVINGEEILIEDFRSQVDFLRKIIIFKL